MCGENFDYVHIIKGRNGLVKFDIYKNFENWGANH